MSTWSAERVNDLREAVGLSFSNLSEATGIPECTLIQYSRDIIRPSIDRLVVLADYFAVPCDYLIGRMTEEECREIRDNYSDCFMKLRKLPYEAYLVGRKTVGEIKGEYESPWPYNLLDAICDSPAMDEWKDIVNDDQMRGLWDSLESLKESEKESIIDYFLHGLTMKKIAEKRGITVERVRQIINHGVRVLRHPMNWKQISEGREGCRRHSYYEDKANDVEKKIAVYEERRQYLKSLVYEVKCQEMEEELKRKKSYPDIGIYEMDMTVRSTNALRRKGAKNLGDVVDLVARGEINKLHAIGKKSIEEILGKVFVLTGEDYSGLY